GPGAVRAAAQQRAALGLYRRCQWGACRSAGGRVSSASGSRANRGPSVWCVQSRLCAGADAPTQVWRDLPRFNARHWGGACDASDVKRLYRRGSSQSSSLWGARPQQLCRTVAIHRSDLLRDIRPRIFPVGGMERASLGRSRRKLGCPRPVQFRATSSETAPRYYLLKPSSARAASVGTNANISYGVIHV